MAQPDFALGLHWGLRWNPALFLPHYIGLLVYAPDGILQISVTAEPWLPKRPSETCLWPERVSWLNMAESSAEPIGMVLVDSVLH